LTWLVIFFAKKSVISVHRFDQSVISASIADFDEDVFAPINSGHPAIQISGAATRFLSCKVFYFTELVLKT
jgi:hypothetical protein